MKKVTAFALSTLLFASVSVAVASGSAPEAPADTTAKTTEAVTAQAGETVEAVEDAVDPDDDAVSPDDDTVAPDDDTVAPDDDAVDPDDDAVDSDDDDAVAPADNDTKAAE